MQKLTPHFWIAQSYTDNVFRTDPTFGGRKPDWYTTLAPGLQLQLPFLRRHKLVFDYRSNIERYSRNPSQNIEDQDVAGFVDLDSTVGLSLNVFGQLKNGHNYRGTAEATAATGSDEPNRFNTPNFGAELQFTRQLFARARYKYMHWQFIGPQAGPSDGTSPGDINSRNRIENYYALAMRSRVARRT